MTSSAAMPTPPADDRPAVSARASWGLLIFLTLLNVLNFVDRTLVPSLAPLLIKDLGMSRAEIGLLAGFGFVLFYSVAGIWLGLAADRWPRIPLLAGGLALWSGMTALSGLARGFLGLAIPRLLVGVGEATLTPAALSMLGDAFPRRRLAMASGVYYAGIPLGTAVSLIASSYIAPRYGWRACFFVLGLLGLVAVAFLKLLPEPPRLGVASDPTATKPRLRDLARDVVRAVVARPTLALTLLGGSLLCYASASAWLAVTWLVEDRGIPYAEAAFTAGIMAIAAGFSGNLLGGLFADWCAKRMSNGHLWSLVAMTALFAPISAGFFLLPAGSPLFYVCWFFTAAGATAWFGPLFAALQQLSPAHTRSSMVAFSLLVLNLLGVGPGPLITGRLGDLHGLTFGLMVGAAVAATAIVPFALAARRAPVAN